MIIEYKGPKTTQAGPGLCFSSLLMEITVESGDDVRLNSVEGVDGVWRLRFVQLVDALEGDFKASLFFDIFALRVSRDRFEVIKDWRGKESFVRVVYDGGTSYRMEKRRARPWWRKRSLKTVKEVRPRRFRP